jgi:hypothetical protein
MKQRGKFINGEQGEVHQHKNDIIISTIAFLFISFWYLYLLDWRSPVHPLALPTILSSACTPWLLSTPLSITSTYSSTCSYGPNLKIQLWRMQYERTSLTWVDRECNGLWSRILNEFLNATNHLWSITPILKCMRLNNSLGVLGLFLEEILLRWYMIFMKRV